MGLLDFISRQAASESKKENKNELKRLKAQEQRLIDMLAKYTDLYQRGRNKAQVINIINDLDKVLGETKNGR